MADEALQSVVRRTARRRSMSALQILKGDVSAAKVEDWRHRFLLGAKNALRSRP